MWFTFYDYITAHFCLFGSLEFVVCAEIPAEFGDVRPLYDDRKRSLQCNTVQFLDRIDVDEAFVSKLANIACITWAQRDHLIGITEPRDRNEKLTEFLTRRSVADFQKFNNLLVKEHASLTPLLRTDGGYTF